MTVIEGVHADHGATFRDHGGRRVVDSYGRPERTHTAVRKVVGVRECGHGVVVVEGADRQEFVDDSVSNRVPATDGRGCYALLLSPQGEIETDMYALNAGERLLLFVPPAEAEPLAEAWSENVFLRDVSIRAATDEFAVFGVHGPKATEKVASVLSTGAPDDHLSFVRGAVGDAGVTVVREDGLAGEEGYLVVCGADAAAGVFDSLVNHGLNAAPFGRRTWETLTLEAGTPLFETELAGRIPNEVGVRNGLDFEKGCYVGQEVVARIENLAAPSRRLVGLTVDGAVPESGAAVLAGDRDAGAVTRAVESPTRGEPIAFAFVDADAGSEGDLSVRVDDEEVSAEAADLPFVEGSDRSARLPTY